MKDKRIDFADQLTLERIKLLHPKIRDEVREIYLDVNYYLLGKGVRLRFSHTLRTIKEQNDLYALGRTKPGKIVTNAKGGQSYHQYGVAFDIVLLLDKDDNGTFETASWCTKLDFDNDDIPDWLEVTQAFEKKGYKNGFLRNGKKWDLPHFQKDFGYSWQQLKAKVDKGDVIKEVINNKEYIFPKI